MKIPDPVAKYGEAVMAHNYRSKPKDGSEMWESGTVSSLSYECNFGPGFQWLYRVRLVRKTSSDGPIFLHVGDDGIDKNIG